MYQRQAGAGLTLTSPDGYCADRTGYASVAAANGPEQDMRPKIHTTAGGPRAVTDVVFAQAII